MEMIVSLTDAGEGFGGKAAHLAELLAGGFDVPAGFAIAPDAPLDDVRAHLAALGDGALVVRSSAIDEDGASASFAGIYDSVLDVRGEAEVRDAIARVRASARSPRALAYRRDGEPAAMAVVVQRLVRAVCAGVMFTADPVTGDRDARIVTAVPGLGEALVSGDRTGEEWHVRDGRPVRRRALERAVLDEAQVLALVALGERIAARFGGPQDIEWVLDDGRFSIVQARPITALPERVAWPQPGGKGAWVRNFRWGEWLSDPVSPLFATWFLPRAEVSFGDGSAEVLGLRPRPPIHHIVNGWYFYAPMGAGGMLAVLGALFRRPVFMMRCMRATADPVAVAPHIAEPFRRVYEDELAPRHRAFAAEVPADDAAAEIAYVDRACDLHGELMFNITLVGGFAWKVEAALATFFRAHCRGVDGAPHELLSALAPVSPCAGHHVCSLDWLHPTAGELGLAGGSPPDVRGDAALRRERLERACLEQLTPQLRERFEALLALARQYARLREEQANELTLAWPNVRTVLHRLGARAHSKGAIDDATRDVFWLERHELDAALAGTRRFQREVDERRATWERQRKLAAPLALGELPGFFTKMTGGLVRDLRGGDVEEASATTLVGMPASAGRATGKVRIVRSPADFDRLGAGEVLVAPTTAPAWTPLFARAVAIVTDGGSVAAHASLVAREYGIPAVVGTTDATQRLHDGQLVMVDGTLGRVELLATEGEAPERGATGAPS
jgi:pyruvate,water dikinase